MNKLWVRLTLAFSLVVAVGLLLTALLANYQIGSQFRNFLVQQQISTFWEPTLTEYYGTNGSWDGVAEILDHRPGSGLMMGQMRGMGEGSPRPILVDGSGQVIYGGTGTPSQLSPENLKEGLPLRWQNEIVGYLLVDDRGHMQLSGAAQTFLQQINRALLQAGIVAAGLGIVIGLVIARGLSTPLNRLVTAARHIAEGNLEQEVPLEGVDEVVDLAKTFNLMAHNLQQAETLRQNMVTDIAHELRTPLSVIQGNLQAILEDVYPLEKDEIASIYEETLILKRLINDLRELSQAEAGQLSLNLQPIALAPLITTTVELFETLASEQDVALDVTFPPDLPLAFSDPERVQQILHNLLINALHHTPAGGQIEINVTLPSANFLQVSVSDTGDGLAASALPYVFDRFWRADKSRARNQGGTGLGLAIARQLVLLQGGQIGVESEGVPGRGSRFWFMIPRAQS